MNYLDIVVNDEPLTVGVRGIMGGEAYVVIDSDGIERDAGYTVLTRTSRICIAYQYTDECDQSGVAPKRHPVYAPPKNRAERAAAIVERYIALNEEV